ncbi:hypothetical protein [Botrimarina sp.]|uniref:hypothetical protein n=1 Tax=Botrimarina sp. TaxID=2795802 RepID=UPI0032EAE190
MTCRRLSLLGCLLLPTPNWAQAENEQFFKIDSDRSRVVYRWTNVSDPPPEEVLTISGFLHYSEANEGYIFPVVWVKPRGVSPVQASDHTYAFEGNVITPPAFRFPSYIMSHEVEGEFGATTSPCNSFNWKTPRHGSCVGGELYPGYANGSIVDGALTLSGVDQASYETAYAFQIYADPVERLPGDADGDGFVGLSDHMLWRANYGALDATRAQGDLNGDSVVDAADYTLWRDSYFGDIAPITAATVPEPASVLIVWITIAAQTATGARRSTS